MRRYSWPIEFDAWIEMPRWAVQDCLVVDLADPAARRALRGKPGAGCLSWWRDGAEMAAVNYSRNGPLAVVLRFRSNDTPIEQVIRLRFERARFGGRRLWFECPITHRPVRALYLPPGAARWAGRAAHALVYESQRTRADNWRRAARMSDREEARRRRNLVRGLRRDERAVGY
jgi:hypothetical protein